ncbi:MAG TPA: MMPL family transporter [Candidatus Hydrogenedentes bacterium]|nr:MMPL family transporter [Candidatus Hydrogenedentota bacterium]
MSAGREHIVFGRLSRFAAYGLIALSLAAIPAALRVRIDNRLERWIEPEGQAARDYERFRELFGGDEFVLVAYTGKELVDEAGLEAQLAALEAIEAAPGVLGVWGLPVLYRDVFGGEDLDALREELHATPFYENFIISEDGAVAGLYIETAPPVGPKGRQMLVRRVVDALAPLWAHGYDVHLVGSPVLNAVLDQISDREACRIFPVAAVCALVILALQFRSFRATLVAVACASLSVLLTVAAMGLSGRDMNMVTSVLPSLLWVLALASIVHILRRYQRRRNDTASREEAIAAALRETARPCAIASITTACGFATLLLADMTPVRELGAFAALGMLIALAVSLTVGPLLIRRLRVPARNGGDWHKRVFETGLSPIPRGRPSVGRVARSGDRPQQECLSPIPRRPWARRLCRDWTDTVARFATRRASSITLVTFVLGALALGALRWVRVEADPLTFLPETSPTVQDYRFVSDRLTGYYTVEMLIDTPDGWLDPAVWPALDRAASEVAASPGVARVLSPLDLLRTLNRWEQDFDEAAYTLPVDRAAAESLIAELDDADHARLARFVAADGRTLRLSALVRVMASNEFLDIPRAAERAITALPEPLSGYVTGIVPQLVQAQLDLVRTQLRSFGWAFVIVFCCILAGLRSWRLTLVSVAPNVIPILVAFVIMAAADIALDAATVMMASVALGIAVDDTVHLIATWQQLRRAGMAKEDAVRTTLGHVGSAMLITTVTACCGFFTLCASRFVPIQYFGLLAGAAMIAALVADLVLTPALLIRFGEDAP